MIGVVGAVTMVFKASGPVLLGQRELPPRVASVVEVLAPAMLAALVVTQTVGGDRELVLDERLAGVVAGGSRRLAARAADRRHGRRRRDRRADPPVLGSPAMQVEEMVERVWPGRKATIEVLGGGITNRNFKIMLDDGAYVLRIGGKDTELLGIDRRVEHEASLAAAAVGVGPEVVAFIEPEGYLVTRFIGGAVVGPEAIREAEALRRIAQSLRAVHAGRRSRRASTRSASSRRTPRRPRRTASRFRRRTSAHARRRRSSSGRAARCPSVPATTTCSPPTSSTTAAGSGSSTGSTRAWETSSSTWRTSPSTTGCRTSETAELLRAYFGDVRPEHERALTLMRFMSDFREAMWGVVQQALSDLDFDFRGYAGDHFERLERTASERAFRKALG